MLGAFEHEDAAHVCLASVRLDGRIHVSLVQVWAHWPRQLESVGEVEPAQVEHERDAQSVTEAP